MKTIIDQIGRVVMGDVEKETKTTLSLKSPVIIHVQPNAETGQLSVQTLPYIFTEFLDADELDKNVWHFNKSHIVDSDVVLDDKIVEAYKALKNPAPEDVVPTPTPTPEVATDGSEANVVDMFEK